jgi:hypothetical protein
MKRNGDQTCFRKDIKAFMVSKGTFLVKSQPTVRMYLPISPGIQAGLTFGPDLLRRSGQEGSD